MNKMFHKAYDCHLLSITTDLKVVVSKSLMENTHADDFRAYLAGLNGKAISKPTRFHPNMAFIETHYSKYVEKWG